MKKRIVIVVGIPNFDYSNEKSAVAAFLRTIKAAFEQEGHDVQLGVESSSKAIHSGGANSGNGIKQRLKSILKMWKWGYQSLAFRSFFKRQDQLIENYKDIKPADLVIEFHTAGSTLGKHLAAKWKCPLSAVFDSPVDEQFFEMYGTKTIFWNKIKRSEKETLEAAESIMTYSPACANFIKQKYTIKGRVSVLPCIVHKPAVANQPEDDTFKIGFVGSFLSWHNVAVLVRAFNRFLTVDPLARLQLIGHGVEWESVNALVVKLGIQNHVELPGFVSEVELQEFKKGFSVAVMPGSNWYGSPLKLVEYAQAQIPFIAPKSKTVLSIFEAEEHCLYINADDAENSLLENLIYLKENPQKKLAMAKRARNFVNSQFKEDIYAKKLVDVLLTKS